MRSYKMPSKKEVQVALSAIKRDVRPDEEGLEVRLQVYENGDWAVRWGDSSYDQDHRGAWGCGILSSKSNCRTLAADLLDDCEEHASQLQSV